MFDRLRNQSVGTTTVDYLKMIAEIDSVADEFVQTYADMEPPDDMVRSALSLRNDIERRRVIFHQHDALHLPLSRETTITNGGMLWLCQAKLGTFVYGLNAQPTCRRRSSLQEFHLGKSIAAGLLLYDDDILNYTVSQVSETMLLIRERWRMLDLEDLSVLNIVYLLELRAGFLAVFSGPRAYMDMPSYCTSVNGQWIVNERFVCDMETYLRVMGRTVAIFNSHTIEPVKDLSQYIRVMPMWPRNVIDRWARKNTNPPPISRLRNVTAWQNFCTHMEKLAEMVTGKNFAVQMQEISTAMRLPLPLAEAEADPRDSECLTLLIQLYSSRGSITREEGISHINLVRLFKDAKTKSEMPPQSVCSLRTPEADLAILTMFDALLSRYAPGWIDKFVVFDTYLHIKVNHTSLHSYPVLLNTMNGWDVLFLNQNTGIITLWRTREALMACYTWCYIIWYAFMGEVAVGNKYSLKMLLGTIFGDDAEVQFGAADAAMDVQSNFQVHE